MTTHTPIQHMLRHTGLEPGRWLCGMCGANLMRDEEYAEITAERGEAAALEVYQERITTPCPAGAEP